MQKRRLLYKPKRKSLLRRLSKSRNSVKSINSKEAKKGELKNIFFTIFLILSFFWFVYFFFVSSSFDIKSIRIFGIENIPQNELEKSIESSLSEKKLIFFSNRNIFLVSKECLKKSIESKYIVDSIEIKKKFPFVLEITINEKLARMILRVASSVTVEENMNLNEISVESTEYAEFDPKSTPKIEQNIFSYEYFYFDVNGIIVSSKDEFINSDTEILPLVEVQKSSFESIKPGDEIMTSEEVGYIFEIYETVKKSTHNFKIEHVNYDPKIKDEFVFITNEGWIVSVNKNINFMTQFKKLEIALEEKIKDQRSKLQYIDLRIKDRVYYKFKD